MQICDVNAWIFFQISGIIERASLFMPGFVSHICGVRLYLTLQNSARKEIPKM